LIEDGYNRNETDTKVKYEDPGIGSRPGSRTVYSKPTQNPKELHKLSEDRKTDINPIGSQNNS